MSDMFDDGDKILSHLDNFLAGRAESGTPAELDATVKSYALPNINLEQGLEMLVNRLGGGGGAYDHPLTVQFNAMFAPFVDELDQRAEFAESQEERDAIDLYLDAIDESISNVDSQAKLIDRGLAMGEDTRPVLERERGWETLHTVKLTVLTKALQPLAAATTISLTRLTELPILTKMGLSSIAASDAFDYFGKIWNYAEQALTGRGLPLGLRRYVEGELLGVAFDNGAITPVVPYQVAPAPETENPKSDQTTTEPVDSTAAAPVITFNDLMKAAFSMPITTADAPVPIQPQQIQNVVTPNVAAPHPPVDLTAIDPNKIVAYIYCTAYVILCQQTSEARSRLIV